VTGRRPVAITLVGLTVALGFAFLPVSEWEHEFASVAHLVGYEIVWWAVVAFVLGWVVFVEKRPLSSIGFRGLRKGDVLAALAVAAAMVAGLAAIYYVVFPLIGFTEQSKMNQLLATPFWWRAISVVCGGVSEEILFRGYGIERLQELTMSRGLAAVISGVLFAWAHVGPWGWGHFLLAGYGAVLLTALYFWRGNLGANMLAHTLVDGVAVLTG
jgi:membrane protease YdiL (CAAX protease family)